MSIPERKLELIMAGAFSIEGRPRLLLDCRGVSANTTGRRARFWVFLRDLHDLNKLHLISFC